MSFLTRKHAVLVALAVVAGLLGTTSATSAPPAVEQKEAEAQTVLAQIQQMDADLEKVIEAFNAAQIRLDEIEAEQRENKHRLEIAKANYADAQDALASRLVALYQGEDATVLEVMLGSESLTDLLDRLDTISRVSDQDVRIVEEITSYRAEVKKREAELAAAQAEQEQVVAERAAHKQEIEAQLEERQRLLASIRDQIQQIKAEEAARQKRLQEEAEQRLAEQQESASSSSGSSESSGGNGGSPAALRRVAAAVHPRRRRRHRNAVPRDALRVGRGLAGRLRLLRVHDVRLRAGRRVAAAQRGHAVRHGIAGLT